MTVDDFEADYDPFDQEGIPFGYAIPHSIASSMRDRGNFYEAKRLLNPIGNVALVYPNLAHEITQNTKRYNSSKNLEYLARNAVFDPTRTSNIIMSRYGVMGHIEHSSLTDEQYGIMEIPLRYLHCMDFEDWPVFHTYEEITWPDLPFLSQYYLWKTVPLFVDDNPLAHFKLWPELYKNLIEVDKAIESTGLFKPFESWEVLETEGLPKFSFS